MIRRVPVPFDYIHSDRDRENRVARGNLGLDDVEDLSGDPRLLSPNGIQQLCAKGTRDFIWFCRSEPAGKDAMNRDVTHRLYCRLTRGVIAPLDLFDILLKSIRDGPRHGPPIEVEVKPLGSQTRSTTRLWTRVNSEEERGAVERLFVYFACNLGVSSRLTWMISPNPMQEIVFGNASSKEKTMDGYQDTSIDWVRTQLTKIEDAGEEERSGPNKQDPLERAPEVGATPKNNRDAQSRASDAGSQPTNRAIEESVSPGVQRDFSSMTGDKGCDEKNREVEAQPGVSDTGPEGANRAIEEPASPGVQRDFSSVISAPGCDEKNREIPSNLTSAEANGSTRVIEHSAVSAQTDAPRRVEEDAVREEDTRDVGLGTGEAEQKDPRHSLRDSGFLVVLEAKLGEYVRLARTPSTASSDPSRAELSEVEDFIKELCDRLDRGSCRAEYFTVIRDFVELLITYLSIRIRKRIERERDTRDDATDLWQTFGTFYLGSDVEGFKQLTTFISWAGAFTHGKSAPSVLLEKFALVNSEFLTRRTMAVAVHKIPRDFPLAFTKKESAV